ncbi:MAG: ligase-associated DNA damage response endonuclease PdeM [Bauldia sp.]
MAAAYDGFGLAGGFAAAAGPRPEPAGPVMRVAGAELLPTPDGALWWAAERLLVVADLHFEKGSTFARRGHLLPPYDTGDTLARLALVVRRFDPRTVVALGDSFHESEAAGRLLPQHAADLAGLQRGRDWIWIAGNHDPEIGGRVGGTELTELAVGPLRFVHEPTRGAAPGEIAGHLHPVVRVVGRGGSTRRRCFAQDGARAVLPAFGAYAGGLSLFHRAFAGLFGAELRPFVCGRDGVYAIARNKLRAD